MSATFAPLASAAPAPAGGLPAGVWRANQLGQGVSPGLPSGFSTLDAQLPGGGWPAGTPVELIAREPGIGELRLLIPVLQQLTRARKVVLFLGPPHMPYAPALSAFGIDLDYLIVVQAAQAADRLWAVEQILRSASFGALLAWLPHGKTRPEHLRRMQLAAQGARGPVFLFRPLPAQFEASPAALRLLLLPRPQQQLSVQILKRRGPVMERPVLLDLPHAPGTLRPGRYASGLSTARPLPDALPSPIPGLLRTAHAPPARGRIPPLGQAAGLPAPGPH